MMINDVIDYLDHLYPKAVCELEYSKDYELLLAIVMSAQTTDKRVNEVNRVLFNKYDTLEKLAAADIQDISDIIKPIGTYKKMCVIIKEICKKLVYDKIDKIPNDREYFEKLPGVGRKTASVFLSVIYGEDVIAVDTHVERVSKRLNFADEKDSVLEVEKKLMKLIPQDKWGIVHHQLVFFGRYKCKSIKPECKDCKLKEYCKYYKEIV